MALSPKPAVRVGQTAELSEREFEILALLFEGASSRAIANSLFCSRRTVEFHVAKIYHKLEVSNRVQALRRAALLGILKSGSFESRD